MEESWGGQQTWRWLVTESWESRSWFAGSTMGGAEKRPLEVRVGGMPTCDRRRLDLGVSTTVSLVQHVGVLC